jgi:hypothetical protein
VAEEMVGSVHLSTNPTALENASTSVRQVAHFKLWQVIWELILNYKKASAPIRDKTWKNHKRVESVTKTPPQAKAPAAKREYTEEEKASAFAVFTLVETQSDVEELKAAWQLNLDLLDVVVEGATLRDHILARKAALNG